MTEALGYDDGLDYEDTPYVPNMSPLPLPPRGTAPEPVHPPGAESDDE